MSLGKAKFLAWSLWLSLTTSALIAKTKAAPSNLHPAPHITGTFIDADGTGRLRLTYQGKSKFDTFTGTIQATCMLPPPSKSGESKPLELSIIPTGTPMTVFYVRRAVGKQSQKVIMALRFDGLPSPGSPLPHGIYIPCVKEQPAH